MVVIVVVVGGGDAFEERVMDAFWVRSRVMQVKLEV